MVEYDGILGVSINELICLVRTHNKKNKVYNRLALDSNKWGGVTTSLQYVRRAYVKRFIF